MQTKVRVLFAAAVILATALAGCGYEEEPEFACQNGFGGWIEFNYQDGRPDCNSTPSLEAHSCHSWSDGEVPCDHPSMRGPPAAATPSSTSTTATTSPSAGQGDPPPGADDPPASDCTIWVEAISMVHRQTDDGVHWQVVVTAGASGTTTAGVDISGTFNAGGDTLPFEGTTGPDGTVTLEFPGNNAGNADVEIDAISKESCSVNGGQHVSHRTENSHDQEEEESESSGPPP